MTHAVQGAQSHVPMADQLPSGTSPLAVCAPQAESLLFAPQRHPVGASSDHERTPLSACARGGLRVGWDTGATPEDTTERTDLIKPRTAILTSRCIAASSSLWEFLDGAR